jgi:hypothetical protein
MKKHLPRAIIIFTVFNQFFKFRYKKIQIFVGIIKVSKSNK